MNIYLKWKSSPFSENENIAIFDLEIIQEENCFARARLSVDALISLPPTGTEGILWESEQMLFKGYLVGHFVKLEGAFGEIELIANPLDEEAQLIALQKENRRPPYWDELWISPKKRDRFQEIQDVRTASLFCHPQTGELSLSDWFQGRTTLDLTSVFFPNSLKVNIVKAPLKSCTVHVHAHWVQWLHGITNLSPHIRRAFPLRQVNTYTEKAVLEKWPEPQKRLGRSGLWVLKSKLKPMFPSSPLYPLYSAPLLLEKEKGAPRTYRMKRYWFKPQLWVRWQRRQKRHETLSLTLMHDFQPLIPGEGEDKIVEFTLQNINPDGEVYPWQPEGFYRKDTKISFENKIYKAKRDHTSSLAFQEDSDQWTFKKHFHTPLGSPARASFFLTERGYKAAEHAMERAKVILAQSARAVDISFEAPWNDLREVTTDTSVTLSDPRLPGGTITGKVVKSLLIAKGETGERIGKLTLLCAVGTGTKENGASQGTAHYSLEDYTDGAYEVYKDAHCLTPSGLSYVKYDDQAPPAGMERGPMVRGIHLTYGPEAQEEEMKRHSSPVAVKKALAENPTHLRIFFKDLRTKEKLEHMISVTLPVPWSAPRQIFVDS